GHPVIFLTSVLLLMPGQERAPGAAKPLCVPALPVVALQTCGSLLAWPPSTANPPRPACHRHCSRGLRGRSVCFHLQRACQRSCPHKHTQTQAHRQHTHTHTHTHTHKHTHTQAQWGRVRKKERKVCGG